jgi:hypothetical protein
MPVHFLQLAQTQSKKSLSILNISTQKNSTYKNIWSVENNNKQKATLRIIPDLTLHLVFDLSGTMAVEPFIIYASKTFLDFEIKPATQWLGLQFNIWQGSRLIEKQEKITSTYYAQFDADWVNFIYFWLLDAKNNKMKLQDSLKALNTFKKFIDDSLNADFEKNFLALASKPDLEFGLAYSERHQRRLFQKITMLSPVYFKKIVRFQEIFQQIIKNKILSWESYYDQSHFIKDFKQFTGFTPKLFLDLFLK